MATAPITPTSLAKIHPDSGVTVRENLDLFKVPGMETSQLKDQSIIINPIRTPPGNQIEHIIPPSDEHYTDLAKSYFAIDLKVTKADGTDLDGDVAQFTVWPGDNFVHSLFSSASVELTNGPIEFVAEYSHNSFVTKLTKKSIATKKGRLTASGWFQDGALCKDAGESTAAAIKERKELIAGSKTYSMVFVPDLASFREKRLFPPGTAFKIVFNRNKDSYSLMSTNGDSGAKIHISKMELHARRVVVNPAIQRPHSAILVKGGSEKFPLRKYRTRTRVVNAGLRSTTLILDQNVELPTMLAVTLTKHSASNGAYKEAPFKLDHFNVSSVELSIDGVPVGKRLETDFANGVYASSYTHTLTQMGMLLCAKDAGITYKNFDEGQTIFIWSLASDPPDDDNDEHYFHLRHRGCIALTLTFTNPFR